MRMVLLLLLAMSMYIVLQCSINIRSMCSVNDKKFYRVQFATIFFIL